MKKGIIALVTGLSITSAAWAGDAVSYTVDEHIDDVAFALESAIIDRGLVIDNISHVGDMLNRTQADVGSATQIFTRAEVFSFCSATLSRKVMEVNPANISFCPYGIFIYATPQNPEQTVIGHDTMPEGEMKLVETLLNDIVKEAAGLD